MMYSTHASCAAFLMIPPHHLKLVVDSIIWAFKHTERNIAETGLMVLMEFLQNISSIQIADAFFKTYFLPLLQDLFFVLTDSFHKSGMLWRSEMAAQKLIVCVNRVQAASHTDCSNDWCCGGWNHQGMPSPSSLPSSPSSLSLVSRAAANELDRCHCGTLLRFQTRR